MALCAPAVYQRYHRERRSSAHTARVRVLCEPAARNQKKSPRP